MCCTGRCIFEAYMGDCCLDFDGIKNDPDIKDAPCFIGGVITCPEEKDEFKKSFDSGEIERQIKIIKEKYYQSWLYPLGVL